MGSVSDRAPRYCTRRWWQIGLRSRRDRAEIVRDRAEATVGVAAPDAAAAQQQQSDTNPSPHVAHMPYNKPRELP